MKISNDDNLLAHWKFDKTHWRKYIKVELRNKRNDNLIFGLVITIFGTLILVFVKGSPLIIALFISTFIGLLIAFIRYKISKKYLDKSVINPEVKVYKTHLIINGKQKDLITKKFWLLNAKTELKYNLNLLSFTIAWNTHRGSTNDEFRIPIPYSQMAEAEQLVTYFESQTY